MSGFFTGGGSTFGVGFGFWLGLLGGGGVAGGLAGAAREAPTNSTRPTDRRLVALPLHAENNAPDGQHRAPCIFPAPGSSGRSRIMLTCCFQADLVEMQLLDLVEHFGDTFLLASCRRRPPAGRVRRAPSGSRWRRDSRRLRPIWFPCPGISGQAGHPVGLDLSGFVRLPGALPILGRPTANRRWSSSASPP